jgi:hypothetical protein
VVRERGEKWQASQKVAGNDRAVALQAAGDWLRKRQRTRQTLGRSVVSDKYQTRSIVTRDRVRSIHARPIGDADQMDVLFDGLKQVLRSGPAWGAYAPVAFSVVNRFCMALLCGRVGCLTAKKRCFPAGADASAPESRVRGCASRTSARSCTRRGSGGPSASSARCLVMPFTPIAFVTAMGC